MPSKPGWSQLLFKNWYPSLFLLEDVKTYGEKIEKMIIRRPCVTGKWKNE